ncbi:MAG TPA: hypothetical protein PKI45_03035 [Candidatus Omnitrophota bacterium]|nr:hypothetical protein [Candidatus Omnitrophota bacterium]
MITSLIVLSTSEQLNTYLLHEELRTSQVFCDNEALFPELTARGIAFQLVDEFILREQWTAINAWGCGRSGRWLAASRSATPPGSPDVLPGIHLYFSCFLIAAAKNRAYANWILEKVKPARVFVFEDRRQVSYPDFSGNDYLNYFLKEIALSQKIEVRSLQAHCPATVPVKAKHGIYALARTVYKKLLTLYLKLFQSISGKYFLVYGALRHLETTAVYLHEKKIPILIYDHEFHDEFFRFAARLQVPYLTADMLPTPVMNAVREMAKSLQYQFESKLTIARREKLFEYQNYEFCDFIDKKIVSTMEAYFYRAAVEWLRCGQMLKRLSLTGCLVEEDFGARANFCEYLKHANVPMFCISHGHGGFEFEPKKEEQTFWQSTTFVNSEHEKIKMYISRGWNGEGIRVSGTPRYDQLYQKLQNRRVKPLPKKILYCAGSLAASSPDTPGYLGVDMVAYRSYQIKAFQAFLKAAEGLPFEILVKSHYDSDDHRWEQLRADIPSQCNVRILKHSQDFHSLLIQSHAMILPCLSTSLIEAALCRIPVLFMDLNTQNNRTVIEFAFHGLCQYIDSTDHLRNALEKIAAETDAPAEHSGQNDPFREYYLGNNFGKATQTTGDIILDRLRQDLSRTGTQGTLQR